MASRFQQGWVALKEIRDAPLECSPGLVANGMGRGTLRSRSYERGSVSCKTKVALIPDDLVLLPILSSLRGKALLRRSLQAVRTAFTQAPDTELERQDIFFGERTTVRRVYMRGLTHMHEHMGQLIAYTRFMGMSAPWPDWRESGRKIIERGQAALRK